MNARKNQGRSAEAAKTYLQANMEFFFFNSYFCLGFAPTAVSPPVFRSANFVVRALPQQVTGPICLIRTRSALAVPIVNASVLRRSGPLICFQPLLRYIAKDLHVSELRPAKSYLGSSIDST